MITQTFVNLPVKDLGRAINFFTELGFEFNSKFTDDNATCMIVNENTFVMLLKEEFFKKFIEKKKISDSAKSTEVIIALQLNSRDEVDEMMDDVLDAGGTDVRREDMDWMYSRTFSDLDNHLWEFVYMDESGMPENEEDEEDWGDEEEEK